MESGKSYDLLKIIDESADELHRQIDMQRHVLTSILENRVRKNTRCNLYVCWDCPHKRILKETLTETIEVLEDTRKAFKSKRLEVLRKRLIEVLASNL